MKFFIFFIALFLSSHTLAWHTASGKINAINVYSETSTVLVTLVNNGVQVNGPAVPDCTSTTTFAIDGSMPSDRRSQMVSILLMAKAAGKTVRFSYSTGGGCVPYGNGRSVYRGIKRIILL